MVGVVVVGIVLLTLIFGSQQALKRLGIIVLVIMLGIGAIVAQFVHSQLQ